MTSTPVQITSVSSSNGVVQTYTSTYYSSYRTPTAVPSPSSEHSTNVGAIVGGVIGGVAFVALIGNKAIICLELNTISTNIANLFLDRTKRYCCFYTNETSSQTKKCQRCL